MENVISSKAIKENHIVEATKMAEQICSNGYKVQHEMLTVILDRVMEIRNIRMEELESQINIRRGEQEEIIDARKMIEDYYSVPLKSMGNEG